MNQQKHTQILSSIFAVLVFTIYLSADLINSLHSSHLHQQLTEEVCTIEQEGDACHRVIYHQDTDARCEHESHFINQIVDCGLCSIVLQRHTLPNTKLELIQATKHLSTLAVIEQIAPKKPFQYSSPQRGPPTFS